MINYHNLLAEIMVCGEDRGDRTGVGTRSVFGAKFYHDMRTGFPLLTTKKIHIKSVVHELLWIISGSTNIQYLNDNGVRIWDEWADEQGNLGPVYGRQWRSWLGYDFSYGHIEEFDQLAEAIETIKTNPESRRIVVQAWNPAQIKDMALPPCHMFFQFYCHTDGGLSLQMYQRSADVFLGVPFNIASYGLLLEMVARVTGRHARNLVINFGDLHIYNNHQEQVREQMTRCPRDLPTLVLPTKDSIDDYVYEDFKFENYDPHPLIKGTVAV